MNTKAMSAGTSDTNGMSFADLDKRYKDYRKNLIGLDFDFLTHMGQVSLQEGRIRRAVEITREALYLTEDHLNRATIYLSLARMYRVMTLMQNTQTELDRAFKELGIEYPRSGFVSFIKSVIGLLFNTTFFETHRHNVEPTDASRETLKLQLAVALYEEAGLSAYYMREPTLSMLQISFRTKKAANQLGPSLELVNWLGATGTLLAIINQRVLSRYFLSRGEKIAKGLADAYPRVKLQIWQALSADYLLEPESSTRLFEQILNEQKAYLTPFDLRLVCITVSCNYTIRGHMDLAIKAVDHMLTEYDTVCTQIFSCSKTFIEWSKIPALSFMGKDEEIERIVNSSKAIFSSVDKEKWLITHFLGNVLIHYYLASQHDLKEVKNIFDRFRALRMSPERTFLEGCHYWVARTYLLFELFYQDKASMHDLRHALSDLKRVKKHPSLQSHHCVLKAHMALLQGDYTAVRENIESARKIAAEVHNLWAECEADKIIMMLSYKEKKSAVGDELFEHLQQKVKQLGWVGYQTHVDKYRNRYVN